MRYISVCSGIEAATVAWHSLGFTPVAFAELAGFPSQVLAHRYPDVPNYRDMSKFKDWPRVPIDLLVGGTPCQSFSVAGLRRGLADPRGNLALTYLAIADKFRPTWLVWENVPGVLSSGGGRDFGSLLGALAQLGYGFAYRVLDAQYFGLAQRRKRVFVVGHLGDWRAAASVLFEPASLSGHPAPRRKTGEGIAPSVTTGAPFSRTGNARVEASAIVPGFRASDLDAPGAGQVLAVDLYNQAACGDGSAYTLTAHLAQAIAFTAQDYGQDLGIECAPTMRGCATSAVAFDASQITCPDNHSNPQPGDPCHTLGAVSASQATVAIAPAAPFAFEARIARNGRGAPSDVVPTLKAQFTGSDAAPLVVAMGFAEVADPVAANQARTYTREGSHNFRVSNVALAPPPIGLSGECNAAADVVPTLQMNSPTGGGRPSMVMEAAMQVRRLTPRECERLQGFPDDYTLIPIARGKLAADGARYKALGNSMAVPVMHWIGRRIQLVDTLLRERERKAS